MKEDDDEGKIKLGEEESSEETDVHAMRLLKELGDDIHSSIKLEYECPSMHTDKKLPVLDVKIWIETGESNKLLHEYYQKTVASRMVIHARSSLPWSTKRTVLTQEVLRILLRCSPELPWPSIKDHVETYMKRMQFSGYTPKLTKSAQIFLYACLSFRLSPLLIIAPRILKLINNISHVTI